MRRSRCRTTLTGALVVANLLAGALALFQTVANAAVEERSRAAPPQNYSVRWTTDPADTNKIGVEVTGLSADTIQELQRPEWKPAQWQELLSVYAGQGDLISDIGLLPMLGVYRVVSNLFRFDPQFPLEPGVNYRAIFHPDRLPGDRAKGGDPIMADFKAPSRQSSPTTVVTHVYPSADVLPENLLKFYVHFSAPMSRGHIYDYMHLRDDAGKEVEIPFLEIDEELWNPAMTRLTLFIDPGRIKRGVQPLEEVGPALQEGKRYRLVIDQLWKDGSGNPLKEAFQKTFSCAGTPGSCVTTPIDLGGPADTVVVELYGTGLRHVSSLHNVSVQIHGQNAPVTYAGPQSAYPGLDQINVQVPRSLAGAGEVSLVLTAQDPAGQTSAVSNAVTLDIK